MTIKVVHTGLLGMFLPCCALAQSVSGSITDSLGLPLPYIPVALVQAGDTALYKGAFTNDSGTYVFMKPAPGLYRIQAGINGYRTGFSKPFAVDSNSELRLAPLLLASTATHLDEVSVSTLKRTVEFKQGNITVNVANSALAAGNTVYDLLMRLPGVSLDPVNNSISIQGREGVRVMIDGRVQQLSGRQLITFLQSISAASIEKIEVLKNPPIRYDAAGTAGLIHIRTKRGQLYGFSGSLSSSASQGFYARGESGFLLQYKARKVSVFSSLFTEYGKFIYENRFERKSVYQDLSTQISQRHIQTETDAGGEANLGLDWQITDKAIAGIKITSSRGKNDARLQGNALFSDSTVGYNRLEYLFSEPDTWNYINYNFNAEHQLDSSGGKLRFSTDYSPNREASPGHFENQFFTNDLITRPAQIFQAQYKEVNYFFSALLDLEKKITPTTDLYAGVKFSRQQLARHYAVNNRNDAGRYVADSAFSYVFNYTEKVMAGYAQVEQELGDVSLQLGLRAEQTLIAARAPGRDLALGRHYFNLFPLLNAEYEAGPKHNWQLSFNQRINRPEAYTLIPYPYFWGNVLVTETGNPDLKPEYSNTIEFTHVYAGVVSNAVSFSRLSNFLMQYSQQNDSSKTMVVSVANLRHSSTLGYSLFFETHVRNWWELRGNATLSYNRYAGRVNGLEYSSSGIGYNGLLTNTFLLPREVKLEVEGQYIGPNPMGVFTPQPRWALNLAFKRSLLKNRKLDLVIGLSDVFYTLVGRNRVRFQNQQWDVSETYDSRRVKISLSYNFGKIKAEPRETSSNEEQREKLRH